MTLLVAQVALTYTFAALFHVYFFFLGLVSLLFSSLEYWSLRFWGLCVLSVSVMPAGLFGSQDEGGWQGRGSNNHAFSPGPAAELLNGFGQLDTELASNPPSLHFPFD